ncbi:hypothetical protein Tco_1370282 [Tanacetum coccineum]|uniref:Uncharacterized protein n=1 Tax=Tanacetum coccineum TaxID=301880 RepID=A0ABQ5ERS5_9ASTR
MGRLGGVDAYRKIFWKSESQTGVGLLVGSRWSSGYTLEAHESTGSGRGRGVKEKQCARISRVCDLSLTLPKRVNVTWSNTEVCSVIGREVRSSTVVGVGLIFFFKLTYDAAELKEARSGRAHGWQPVNISLDTRKLARRVPSETIEVEWYSRKWEKYIPCDGKAAARRYFFALQLD